MHRLKKILGFILWTLLPTALGAATSALGLLAATPASAKDGNVLLEWAIVSGVALAVLLLAKAIKDYKWAQTEERARFETIKVFRNQVGPALQVLTELAMTDATDSLARQLMLRDIARQFCNAAIVLSNEPDVRVAVFAIYGSPDRIEPIAHAGRSEPPRVFDGSSDAGKEVMAYLNKVPPKSELFSDTSRSAPLFYAGDPDRYESFVRVPIWANRIVFGMLTIDGPAKSLSANHQRVAELIAAQLEPAFAVAAA